MIKLRTPKLWLLTTAALIFGSQMSATAQTSLNYQSGAPTMVAAAPGFPSISAEQIARDVTSEFNPRTGLRELFGMVPLLSWIFIITLPLTTLMVGAIMAKSAL